MAAGAMVEDAGWLGELQGELRGVLAPVFAQARSRLTAFAYIGALLSERGDRKSCWQLAEEAGHATPRRMQALLAEYAWDWKAALAALQRFITARLGDDEAIFVLDETAELKKGTATAGVARQHAGITGQVENCQTVVFAAYVTARAHALLDFRLYLPKGWCADQARREKAHIPDGTVFATKPVLGTQMITGAGAAPGQARPVATAGTRHDPADHPGDQAPARRPHHPAPAPVARHPLGRMDPPPPSPLTMVPQTRQTRPRRRDRPGQLAKCGCRTGQSHTPYLRTAPIPATSMII